MLTSDSLAKDFPSLRGRTYLDTAAEGIAPLCAEQSLRDFWQDKMLGMEGRVPAYAARDQCREVAARMLALSPAEVSFCSCSAEAYNLLGTALELGEEDEVIISDLDFPSGVTGWLAPGRKAKVHVWRAREGMLRLEDLRPLLNARTRLVQVSLVSFYNGHWLPWKPFAAEVRRHAPQALLAVDVTQALGRCVLDCLDADFIVSSTHKWTLGISGGGIVGIPQARAEQLTTKASGWFHLSNAFAADRFEKAVPKRGAESFSVGQPSFAPLYFLNSTLRYLESVGVEAIAQHADKLVRHVHAELPKIGLKPMAPLIEGNISGIVSFQHPDGERIHRHLLDQKIHIMNMVERLRISLHGYNTEQDVEHLLRELHRALKK